MNFYTDICSGRFSVDWLEFRSGYAGVRKGFFKRLIDILGSLFALLFFLPVLVVLWCLVRMSSPGPGLFWSRRVGRYGQIFLMPKFRSMRQGTPLVSREALSDADAALTPLGHFLRRSSLDELPQFWSVLRGEMSLVGPRALIPNDIAMGERRRYPEILSLRPGITGLAQIRGRNAVMPRAKARYDSFYARKRGFGMDVGILWRTVIAVLTARNVF